MRRSGLVLVLGLVIAWGCQRSLTVSELLVKAAEDNAKSVVYIHRISAMGLAVRPHLFDALYSSHEGIRIVASLALLDQPQAFSGFDVIGYVRHQSNNAGLSQTIVRGYVQRNREEARSAFLKSVAAGESMDGFFQIYLERDHDWLISIAKSGALPAKLSHEILTYRAGRVILVSPFTPRKTHSPKIQAPHSSVISKSGEEKTK